jgi:hypothetical protein
MRAPGLLAVAVAVAACGVGPARFVKNDPAFEPRPAASDPQVFLDRRPPRAYQAVGVIQLRRGEPLARAVALGREVGCDLLVARVIHDLYHEGAALRVRVLAQGRTAGGLNQVPPASTIAPSDRGRDTAYVCGRYAVQ